MSMNPASLLPLLLVGCDWLFPASPPSQTPEIDHRAWIRIDGANGICAPQMGWIARPLFSIGADESALLGQDPASDPRVNEVEGAAPPPPLGRYCLYLPAPGAVEQVPLQGATVEQQVVAPESGAAAAWLADKTDQELCFLGEPGDGPVRLTLLDTSPSGPGDPGDATLDDHGEAMARLARHLCPSESCGTVEIVHRIAMPLRLEDERVQWFLGDGGRLGTVDWLAQAVYRSVLDAGEKPHVINLSLAFHADYADLADHHDVAALRDALIYARCSGALIIAAAGNRSGPTQDSTPQYPAAWSTDHDWSCDAFSLPTPAVPGGDPAGGKTPPLVYAAGAIGYDELPIGLSRPSHASTPLVAYALGVTTDPERSPLTGTSLAAVAVSVGAARAWSRIGPDATADEVVLDVWTNGKDLERTADFGTVYGDPGVHRIAQCAPASLDWPVLADCQTCEVVEGSEEDTIYGSDVALASYSPFTSPAPDTAQCPVCDFVVGDATGQLTMDLPNFQPNQVSGLRLSTQEAGRSTWTRYTLTLRAEPATFRLPVTNVPARAVLTFESGGVGYAAEIPVLQRP
ncbi:MAG: S8/S53 family peptidase [Myxococcota bacterium]